MDCHGMACRGEKLAETQLFSGYADKLEKEMLMHVYKVCQDIVIIHREPVCMRVSQDAWCTDKKKETIDAINKCAESETVDEARAALRKIIAGQCETHKLVYGDDFVSCAALEICSSKSRNVQVRELSWKESLKVWLAAGGKLFSHHVF